MLVNFVEVIDWPNAVVAVEVVLEVFEELRVNDFANVFLPIALSSRLRFGLWAAHVMRAFLPYPVQCCPPRSPIRQHVVSVTFPPLLAILPTRLSSKL